VDTVAVLADTAAALAGTAAAAAHSAVLVATAVVAQVVIGCPTLAPVSPSRTGVSRASCEKKNEYRN